MTLIVAPIQERKAMGVVKSQVGVLLKPRGNSSTSYIEGDGVPSWGGGRRLIPPPVTSGLLIYDYLSISALVPYDRNIYPLGEANNLEDLSTLTVLVSYTMNKGDKVRVRGSRRQ